MPLVNIIIVLVVVGVALWGINKYIPMAGPIKNKKIINIVVPGQPVYPVASGTENK